MISISSDVKAQNPELVWLKYLEMDYSTNGLFAFQEDSVYVLKFSSSSESLNVGVWNDQIITGLNSDLPHKYVVYDQDFNPFGILEFSLFDALIRPLGVVDSVLYMSALLEPGSAGVSVPEIVWTHPSAPSGVLNQFLLAHDLAQNSLHEVMVMRNSYPNILNTIPFPGYLAQSGLPHQTNLIRNGRTCLVPKQSDQILCSRLFYEDLYVNEFTYQNPTTRLGTATVIYNTAEGGTAVHPVHPQNGSNFFDFAYFESEQPEHHYRIGSFRGTTSPVNAGGDSMEGYPTDSSYVVYLAKEHETGESEYMTPLFSYNNLKSDTTNAFANSTRLVFHSMAELDGNTYLSYHPFFHSAHYSDDDIDTLYTTDVFGNHEKYYDMYRFHSSLGDTSYPYRALLDEQIVIKLSEEGVPAAKLSRAHIHNPVDAYIHQVAHLFHVGESLIWLSQYAAVEDTSVALVRTLPQNITDTTWVDIPSGKHLCLFVLDASLNLTDTWLITHSGPVKYGVNIDYISAYNGDTLLIHGYVQEGTVTSLDPFGNSPEQTYSATGAFLAYFSGVDIVDVKDPLPATTLKIRPNPTEDFVIVELGQDVRFNRYEVYDSRGGKINSGTLSPEPRFRLSVGNYPPGVYILHCVGNEHKASAKFVVR